MSPAACATTAGGTTAGVGANSSVSSTPVKIPAHEPPEGTTGTTSSGGTISGASCSTGTGGGIYRAVLSASNSLEFPAHPQTVVILS